MTADGAGTRTSTDAIERDVWIDAPVQRVWHVLTDPGHLGTWFGDAGADLDLRPGGELVLRWAGDGTVRGRIEEVEQDRRLVFWWAPFRSPGGAEPVQGNATRVQFDLAAEAGGTRLRVRESGFDGLAVPADERRRNRTGNEQGWELELSHLRDHVVREGR